MRRYSGLCAVVGVMRGFRELCAGAGRYAWIARFMRGCGELCVDVEIYERLVPRKDLPSNPIRVRAKCF